MVVDDEEAVRRFLSEVLLSGGFEVSEAFDGRMAMELMASDPVDVIVTDLVMPEQEGIETIRLLKRLFPAVKIIAVSGAFEGRVLAAARLLGANAALPKPLGPELLLETVRNVLGQ
jgi:CheY-like chemotaxis protein